MVNQFRPTLSFVQTKSLVSVVCALLNYFSSNVKQAILFMCITLESVPETITTE